MNKYSLNPIHCFCTDFQEPHNKQLLIKCLIKKKTISVPEEFDDPVEVEVLYLVLLLGGGSLLLLALALGAAFVGGCFLMAPFLFCTSTFEVPALTTGASGPSLSLLCSGLNMLFVLGCCLGVALF